MSVILILTSYSVRHVCSSWIFPGAVCQAELVLTWFHLCCVGFLKLTLKDHPHLRVILMSATLDADKFASYWGADTPRIHIPGRTFPVADFMLEDVLSITEYIPPKNKKKKKWHGQSGNRKPRKTTPWADSERSDDESDGEDGAGEETPGPEKSFSKGAQSTTHSIPLEDLVARVDESDLDYDMLAVLVRHLVRSKGPEDDGSILVFLAGAPEINNAMESIKRVAQNLPLHILPLHGGLQPKDQCLVFEPPKNGLTKVILSTNVAESSITVPDCTIVIDSCREKESSYDPTNRMPLLLEQFASKASLEQRRGRAGRVREGKCYKLISRSTYERRLQEFSTAEIRRVALDATLLSLMFLGVERGSGTFTRQLMDPPSQESVDAAIFSLRKLGAVAAGESPGEYRLTPLGLHLAGMSCELSPQNQKYLKSFLPCLVLCLTILVGIPAPPSVGKRT
jgi:ATP-dependent RNA helicase DHX57